MKEAEFYEMLDTIPDDVLERSRDLARSAVRFEHVMATLVGPAERGEWPPDGLTDDELRSLSDALMGIDEWWGTLYSKVDRRIRPPEASEA